MPSKKAQKVEKSESFQHAARRLGCDDNKVTFEKRLGKIAKAKPSSSQKEKKG
jgi:hypothetical protein